MTQNEKTELFKKYERFYLDLARKAYRKYQTNRRHVELADLEQEAAFGFLRALKTYDPSKGAVTTYAANWVNVYLNRYLIRNMGVLTYASNKHTRFK